MPATTLAPKFTILAALAGLALSAALAAPARADDRTWKMQTSKPTNTADAVVKFGVMDAKKKLVGDPIEITIKNDTSAEDKAKAIYDVLKTKGYSVTDPKGGNSFTLKNLDKSVTPTIDTSKTGETDVMTLNAGAGGGRRTGSLGLQPGDPYAALDGAGTPSQFTFGFAIGESTWSTTLIADEMSGLDGKDIMAQVYSNLSGYAATQGFTMTIAEGGYSLDLSNDSFGDSLDFGIIFGTTALNAGAWGTVDIPTPGAAALLVLGGLTAARRRRS